MLLDNQGQHRVLGRIYTDDQLFRIIVPKSFTLHAYPLASQIQAGFSEKVISTSGDIRPDFSDEEIALVLQYRWPEELGDIKASDIDAVNKSVRGGHSNLGSEADILNYNDLTLSDYCHEKLYENKARREQILSNFKAELHKARRLRAAAVEERFRRAEPGVLQYIIIAKVHHALSYDSIAISLNRLCGRPAGLESYFNNFDAGLVEEIFQLHAEARTTVFEQCLRRDWGGLSLVVVPTEKMRREDQNQKRSSPVTPAAMNLAESQGEERNKGISRGDGG